MKDKKWFGYGLQGVLWTLEDFVITIIVIGLLCGWIFGLVSAVLVFKDAQLMQTLLTNTPVFAAIEGFLAMLGKL